MLGKLELKFREQSLSSCGGQPSKSPALKKKKVLARTMTLVGGMSDNEGLHYSFRYPCFLMSR
jgi:hypothetical protein